MPRMVEMVEMVLHDARLDALFEGEHRPRVAQAVQREAIQAIASYPAEKHLTRRIRVQPVAIGLMEHKSLVIELGTHEHSLF